MTAPKNDGIRESSVFFSRKFVRNNIIQLMIMLTAMFD